VLRSIRKSERRRRREEETGEKRGGKKEEKKVYPAFLRKYVCTVINSKLNHLKVFFCKIAINPNPS
jgi:hypothetical protein